MDICLELRWNNKVVESETMETLSKDKVPFGDNWGATHGKLYLIHDFARLNVSSFLDLYAHVLKGYTHILERHQDHHQL